MRRLMALENMETVSICIFSLLFFPQIFVYSGFDDGSPDGNDPLQLARTMASRGITLASFILSQEVSGLRPANLSISSLWPASPP